MKPAELKAAIEPLLELKLLRRGTETESLLPVRPDIAAADFSAPMEEHIHAQMNQLRLLRTQVLSLLPVYEEHLAEAGDRSAVQVFDDPGEVRGLLRIATTECREEVVTVQPGGARNHRTLAEALPRDIAMLERGIRMRVLYQHTARGDLATRSYVSKIVESGAEVRTTGQIAERLIVFDRKIAFLPNRPRDNGPPGAAVVQDRVVVAYLLRLLDQMWEDAAPFEVSDLGYQGTVVEVRRSILRLMARGLSDEAVARRMGMALRTCRRHIAAIMQDLGVSSRFQAGIAAQRRGLLDDVADVGFTEEGSRETG
ncbi:helix-turn-helix transcriptional regulator [Streptomyces rhizosphaerihabitans]|uniref:helix-turn-helix transcriptional regulator n=1 Tax=Streptomyces rhizosphaerihabitans TaxID=1266770 RepID=UPI0021BFCF77|nr:helix-turn-helix transcriptional regulator [Streptomyces rhizosphaerihabitans]MCT9008519.1 LuxR C-terminal-related transcriptional regulator [Streptomyces rhizosphaerihabitans]